MKSNKGAKIHVYVLLNQNMESDESHYRGGGRVTESTFKGRVQRKLLRGSFEQGLMGQKNKVVLSRSTGTALIKCLCFSNPNTFQK